MHVYIYNTDAFIGAYDAAYAEANRKYHQTAASAASSSSSEGGGGRGSSSKSYQTAPVVAAACQGIQCQAMTDLLAQLNFKEDFGKKEEEERMM